MEVNGRKIGIDQRPYVIAELSANHGGSIERAKKSIYSAALSGVDAIKIQTYTPDTMTIDSDKNDFQILSGLWKGHTLYQLYGKAFTPFEWHKEIFEYASELGVTLFSTPFDESALELLEGLKTPAYKIASFELTDIPLIENIARKNKPIFLSTGMGSLEEISDAVEIIKKYNNSGLLLFHCISSYPAPVEQSNLSNLLVLKKEFDVDVGLSDHTLSNIAATVAIGMGASAIEKHFKLDADDCGPDSSFSLTPKSLVELVECCNQSWLARGEGIFKRADAERENLVFRRSLYFVKDKNPGEKITEGDVRRIRPGFGISPKYYSKLLGMRLTKKVERGDPVTWDMIE